MKLAATATGSARSARTWLGHPFLPAAIAVGCLTTALLSGRPTIALVAVGAGTGASLSGSV